MTPAHGRREGPGKPARRGKPAGSSTPSPAPIEDHVDRVRGQWRGVAPELDTSPVAVVARVGRAAAYFDQAINVFLGRYELTRSSWDILASLRRVDAPYELTPTDLYRGLMRTSGWMTNRLHELERAGLVERRPDPADRRGVVVRLTRRGVALVDEIVEGHLDNERRLLAALSAADREALAALLRQLLLGLEQAGPAPPRQRQAKGGRRRAR